MSTETDRTESDVAARLRRGGRGREFMLVSAGAVLLLAGAALWLTTGSGADVNGLVIGGLFALTVAVSIRGVDLILAHLGMRLDMRARLRRAESKLAEQRARLQRLAERTSDGTRLGSPQADDDPR